MTSFVIMTWPISALSRQVSVVFASAKLACQHASYCRCRPRIHHSFMDASNRVNFQSSSDEGVPAVDGGLGITVRSRKQHCVTMKSSTRKCSRQVDVVADDCSDHV